MTLSQGNKPQAAATRRRGARLALVVGGSLLVLAFLGGALLLTPSSSRKSHGLILHTVTRESLQRTLTARGDLEPAESSEIVCRLRGLRRNRTYVSTIKTVVEDGTYVQPGQVLVELDDTEYREELDERSGPLEQARVAWVQAEQEHQILESENEAAILGAETAITLAELDLKKFLQGDQVQFHKDLEGRLALALSDRTLCTARAEWSDRMRRRGYLARSQAIAEEARTTAAEFAVDGLRERQRVYDSFTVGRTRADLEGKVTVAKANHAKIRRVARAKAAQAEAACLTAERIYTRRLQRQHEIQEEVRKCVLRAPHAGLVVYAMSGQTRSGSGSQNAIIAPGEPVREGQTLMRLPDLSRMVVNIRIHEALVGQIRADAWEATGFGETFEATAVIIPGSVMSRISLTAAFGEVRAALHDYDRRKVAEGLPALVRVAGLEGRVLRGHVKHIAPLPSRIDAMSGEVNMYRTRVLIDDPVEGIKPDLSAEVTILQEDPSDPVIAIPVEAVVHDPGEGTDCTCYVMTPDGPVEREIRIGIHTDRLVEVQGGLEEGDQVILNPKLLHILEDEK